MEKTGNDNDNAIYESSDYKRILELHHKIDEFSDWTAPLSCVLLTQILDSQTPFFNEIENELNGDSDSASFQKFQEFVSTLMLQNFESFVLNTFALQQPEMTRNWPIKSEKEMENIEYKNYGTAIFATTSLINHSCLPNASVSFQPRFGVAVVTSIRDLRAGEDIRISYGPMVNSYNSSTAEERMNRLKRNYGFDCDCEGCARGWPGLKFTVDSKISSEEDMNQPQEIMKHPVEKLAECQEILHKMTQKNKSPEDFLSPHLLKILDDYRHQLKLCISMTSSNFPPISEQ